MSISFGNGVTNISTFWTAFKATVTSKSLAMQYLDDGITTTVFAFDGPGLVYTATMWDGGNVPVGVQASYSISQNNTDLTDFTTNWQSIANQPSETSYATGTLGALNATVQISMSGNQSVGVQINAGTFVGTIVAETSFDNGNNWNQTIFVFAGNTTLFSKSFSISNAVSPNIAQAATIVVYGGSGLVRVRVFAYTSGSCGVTMQTTGAADETIDLFTAVPGLSTPPVLAIVGGEVTTAAPTYTTATVNGLSLNTSGGLRVDGSGVTQPVSISGTVPVSGTVANTQSTSPWVDNVTQFGGVAVAAVAKGTQATNALGVQDFKDSGRVSFVAVANALTGVTSEALISLTPVRTVTAGGAATSLTVTSGKTLRLQALVLTLRNTTTTQVGATIRVRMLGGTVLVGSQEFFSLACTTAAATSGFATSVTLNFPDGFEISGTTQVGITQLCSSTSCTLDVSLIGFEY